MNEYQKLVLKGLLAIMSLLIVICQYYIPHNGPWEFAIKGARAINEQIAKAVTENEL